MLQHTILAFALHKHTSCSQVTLIFKMAQFFWTSGKNQSQFSKLTTFDILPPGIKMTKLCFTIFFFLPFSDGTSENPCEIQSLGKKQKLVPCFILIFTFQSFLQPQHCSHPRGGMSASNPSAWGAWSTEQPVGPHNVTCKKSLKN